MPSFLKLALPHLSIYFPPLLVIPQLLQKLIPKKHPTEDGWSWASSLPQDAEGSGLQTGEGCSVWWFLHEAKSLILSFCDGKAEFWWVGGNCQRSLYLFAYVPAHLFIVTHMSYKKSPLCRLKISTSAISCNVCNRLEHLHCGCCGV